MLLKSPLFFIVLILISSNIYGQFYEAIKEDAANYFLALANNSSDSQIEFEKLKSSLYSRIDLTEAENTYQTKKQSLDSLKNHFNEYESIIKNISKDSALVLFNQWYLHFSKTFYNYAQEKFFSSEKVKLLLFSASVSCACTLEMCRKQTIDLINFAKQNGYDYWIVDSFENNQLQIEYETLFAPSVIVLDENNKCLLKIQYDENMISKLSVFLDGKSAAN